MICPACAASILSGGRFCPSCGAPIRLEGTAADALRHRLQSAVEGTFTIERLLGRGGMGAVYLAREPALDRLVAIKVLPPDRAQSPELRERFRREARTAAQLSHPNIVPLLSFGEDDGFVYFVMGYVEGETLSTRLRRDGRLEVAQAVRILTELAQALSYAHSRAVVHRDVKPDNVLLELPNDIVRLTDFGVAKRDSVASLTAEGVVIGTPLYMSPEQASGRVDVDARTDIYSLGALAFTLFTGRPPFEGRSASEIMRQHLTRDVPRMREHVPGIPPAIEEAVRRCLAKEASARWRDALEFAAALSSTGDSWWGALLRRTRPGRAPASRTPAPAGAASTPSPSNPEDYRAALSDLARRLLNPAVAARVGTLAARLADDAQACERARLGLQLAADAIEVKRIEKRLASLRDVVDPSPEVIATVEALRQLKIASHAATGKLNEVASARASTVASLRRLYAAVRRAVAAPDDAATRADLEALCDMVRPTDAAPVDENAETSPPR